MENYSVLRRLGKGAFGLVSLARSVVTNQLVAMKTVDKSKLTSENLRKTVEHEIRILKRLRHKRIVKTLLEFSANTELRDVMGKTPFMSARSTRPLQFVPFANCARNSLVTGMIEP